MLLDHSNYSRVSIYVKELIVSSIRGEPPELDDYGVKHYVVEIVVGGTPYIIDAVPELTGLIPRHCDVGGAFVETIEEYAEMFETIAEQNRQAEANPR